jgi:hypothetical protein
MRANRGKLPKNNNVAVAMQFYVHDIAGLHCLLDDGRICPTETRRKGTERQSLETKLMALRWVRSWWTVHLINTQPRLSAEA